MIRRMLVAATVAVSAAAVLGAAPAAAQPGPNPATCAEVRAAVPQAADGNYLLRSGSRIVPVYCHGMAGTPREYVTLNASNFSQYTAGGASPGGNVRTTFTKVRINPATLLVDINDLTFATSTGQLSHGGGPVTSMPYGVGMSCDSRPSGVGRIDLTGTAFLIDDTFVLGGFNPAGGATVAANERSADLAGGGYCGWINPAPYVYQPMNPSTPDYRLQLACAPFNVLDLLLGRGCLDLTP